MCIPKDHQGEGERAERAQRPAASKIVPPRWQSDGGGVESFCVFSAELRGDPRGLLLSLVVAPLSASPARPT